MWSKVVSDTIYPSCLSSRLSSTPNTTFLFLTAEKNEHVCLLCRNSNKMSKDHNADKPHHGWDVHSMISLKGFLWRRQSKFPALEGTQTYSHFPHYVSDIRRDKIATFYISILYAINSASSLIVLLTETPKEPADLLWTKEFMMHIRLSTCSVSYHAASS